jgi:hypothetical protein
MKQDFSLTATRLSRRQPTKVDLYVDNKMPIQTCCCRSHSSSIIHIDEPTPSTVGYIIASDSWLMIFLFLSDVE